MNKKCLAGIIFLCLTLSFSPTLFAQCPTGDVILSSQAEVDSYVANYSACTSLPGSLTIGDNTPPISFSDITDISGLSNLTSIGQDLSISANPLLTSLAGLNNITTVGMTAEILDNDNLINIDALNSVATIGRNLKIEGNDALTTISGLNDLYVNFTLTVINNASLVTITGLNNFTTDRGIIIAENPNLMSITGLNNHDPGLAIAIMDNISLVDVSGLSVINPARLVIKGNHILDVCTADGICDIISLPLSHDIDDNGPNCSTIADIEDQCLLALPVSLISFEANKNGSNIQLNWETAQERNNAGFFIQYSNDAQNWIDISFVNGQVNSDRINAYSFLHTNVTGSKNYYRLKQMDIDGQYSLSEVQLVRFDLSINDRQIAQVFPNPSSGSINIQFEPTKNSNSILLLSDSRGQLVWQKQLLADKNPSVIFEQLDLPQNQLYFLLIQTGQESQVIKIQTIDLD